MKQKTDTPESNHEQIQALLSPYLDGELTTTEKKMVEQALLDSASLRQELVSLQQTVALLRALPAMKVPRPLTLRESDVGPISRHATQGGWLNQPWLVRWVGGLVAAMFVLTVGGVLFFQMGTGGALPQSAPQIAMVKEEPPPAEEEVAAEEAEPMPAEEPAEELPSEMFDEMAEEPASEVYEEEMVAEEATEVETEPSSEMPADEPMAEAEMSMAAEAEESLNMDSPPAETEMGVEAESDMMNNSTDDAQSLEESNTVIPAPSMPEEELPSPRQGVAGAQVPPTTPTSTLEPTPTQTPEIPKNDLDTSLVLAVIIILSLLVGGGTIWFWFKKER